MSEHANMAAADLDHAQQLLARAERAEGEARELRAESEEDHVRFSEIALRNILLLAERDALPPIVTAARAWADAVLAPDADLVAASQALLDAVEGEGEA